MLRNVWIAIALIGCCGLGACSTESEEPLLPPEVEEEKPWKTIERVTVKSEDIVSGNTSARTAFTLESNKLVFSWASGDKIGIFPTSEGDSQVALSIKSGADTNTANFTGGGWALRDDITYVAYYPYVLEGTNANILFNYEGQHQTGNASLAHLGAHDFMATQRTSATEGELNFHFKHLNSFALLNLTVPVAANFTSLTIWCDEAIFAKTGKLDFSSETYSYTQEEATDRLKMQLSEVSSTEANQTLTFYLNLFPLDMSGKTVKVTLQSDENKVYESTLVSKTLEAGKAYRFDATLIDVTVSTTVETPSFGESNI